MLAKHNVQHFSWVRTCDNITDLVAGLSKCNLEHSNIDTTTLETFLSLNC